MVIIEALYSMFANKCTRCHKGDIFEEKNPYKLGKMFKMHETCNHCHLKYDREPGFFYGAMYVSYALTVGWFIIWFALQSYVFQWSTTVFLTAFISFLVLSSPLTLRWSRIIWLNIFFRYHKEYERKDAAYSDDLKEACK